MEHNTRHPRMANELPKRSIHPARVLTAGHQKRAAESTESWFVSIPRSKLSKPNVDNGTTLIIIIIGGTIFFTVIVIGAELLEFFPD